jgi:activator of HSP90 ATPase
VIESIRILPDRECAFINYSSVEEASRARDTVINKMSSRLSNVHVVKVGFGKLDINNNATTSTATSSTTTSTVNYPSTSSPTTESVQGPTRALCMFYLYPSFNNNNNNFNYFFLKKKGLEIYQRIQHNKL